MPGPWLQRLVGLVLLASAWRLGRKTRDPATLRTPSAVVLAAAGGGLGLLAGVLVLAGLKLLGLRLG